MMNNRRKQLAYAAPPVRVVSPALADALRLMAVGVSVREWSDAALDAYAATLDPAACAWIASLSGDQLDALIDDRPDAPVVPAHIYTLSR